MPIFRELKRRNVFRVAAAYAVTAWLLLQLIDVVAPIIEAPDWVPKALLLLVIVGFPVSLLFAWAFELTPEGLKFERDVDRAASITYSTGRKLDFVIISVLSIALIVFAVDRFLWRETTLTIGESDRRSIAVLPFANMSGDPGQQFFSDGISEEILNALVRVDGISVASRTSSFRFRGDQTSIRAIAEELGVLFVLEGSVRKDGEQLRITAQLIEAESDRHLWSETYDKQLEDVFAIQTDIANSITRSIQGHMGIEAAAPQQVKTLTQDMDAYELYLKGYLAYQHRAVPQDVIDSITYLELAVARDPQFAVAWQYLGAAYATLPYWPASGIDFDEYIRKSNDAAERALALDPELAFAHTILAENLSVTPPYDRKAAERQYELAAEKGSVEPTSYNWQGIALGMAGYLDESTAALQRCLQIDPEYRNCRYGLHQVYASRNDAARRKQLADEIYGSGEWSRNLAFIDVLFLLTLGERNAAVIAVAHVDGFEDAPYMMLIEALDNPDEDHSAALRRYEAWAEENNIELSRYPELLAALGAYDRVDFARLADYWYWLPVYARFRQSDHFKSEIRRMGILAQWREKGFPPMCRPAGKNDFECD